MMKKVAIGVVAVAFFLGIKSCGEPYDSAKDVVDEFMEEIQEGEGKEAIKYLHPSYRDSLAKDLKIPVQFTEMKPSQVLSCILSSMGENIEDVDVKEGKMLNEKTALIKVEVEDKEEVKKIFTFVVIKEGDDWLIADITPYTPVTLNR